MSDRHVCANCTLLGPDLSEYTAKNRCMRQFCSFVILYMYSDLNLTTLRCDLLKRPPLNNGQEDENNFGEFCFDLGL